MEEKEIKKSKKGIIIGIICAAAVLAALACVAAVKLLGTASSPEKQLAKGLLDMAAEMAAYKTSMSDDIGFDELRERGRENPMRTKVDLSITMPEPYIKDIDNLSVVVDSVTDLKNEKAQYDICVGTYGFTLDIGTVKASGDTVYISAPIALGEDIYSIDLANLGADFNSSAWSRMLETRLPEDYTVSLFGKAKEDGGLEAASLAEQYSRFIAPYREDVKGAVTYEKLSERKDFAFGGQIISCGGVAATMEMDACNRVLERFRNDILASDAYARALEDYMRANAIEDAAAFRKEADELIEEMMSMRLEEDFTLNFYMDAKGRIVNISTPSDVSVSGGNAFSVDISFMGKERTLDNVEGGIYFQSGGQLMYLGIERTADVTQEMYREDFSLVLQDDSHEGDITVRCRNDWSFADKSCDMAVSFESRDEAAALSGEITYSDVVKGERCTFRINNAVLSRNGEDILIMSAVVGTEPAEGTVEIPGSATNLLGMSETDIRYLAFDVLTNLSGYMKSMRGPF